MLCERHPSNCTTSRRTWARQPDACNTGSWRTTRRMPHVHGMQGASCHQNAYVQAHAATFIVFGKRESSPPKRLTHTAQYYASLPAPYLKTKLDRSTRQGPDTRPAHERQSYSSLRCVRRIQIRGPRPCQPEALPVCQSCHMSTASPQRASQPRSKPWYNRIRPLRDTESRAATS